MAVNRVDYGGNTLIDLTGDTLESAEQLLKGIIAHAKDGSVITGLMEAGGGGGGVKIGNFTTVNYGSFQLAEDASSYTIDLGYKGAGGLPVVEQFIILRDMPSTFSGTSTTNSLVIAAELENVSSATAGGRGVCVARYYNSSGSISTSTAIICSFNQVSSATTPRTITVNANNAKAGCRLTAGATYNWIALRREEQ